MMPILSPYFGYHVAILHTSFTSPSACGTTTSISTARIMSHARICAVVMRKFLMTAMQLGSVSGMLRGVETIYAQTATGR